MAPKRESIYDSFMIFVRALLIGSILLHPPIPQENHVAKRVSWVESEALMLPLQNWWHQNAFGREVSQVYSLLRNGLVTDEASYVGLWDRLLTKNAPLGEVIDTWIRLRIETYPEPSIVFKWFIRIIQSIDGWVGWWENQLDDSFLYEVEEEIENNVYDFLMMFQANLSGFISTFIPQGQITTHQLLQYRLIPSLDGIKNQTGRFLIGVAGRAASGKTGLMEEIYLYLRSLMTRMKFRVFTVSTDDFLIPLELRKNPTTQEINEKWDIPFLNQVLERLSNNSEVLHPMVDTEAKGRWAFHVNQQNQIVLSCGSVEGPTARNGNREIVIGFYGEHGLTYKEFVRQDNHVMDVTKKQSRFPVWELLNQDHIHIKSASTPILIRRIHNKQKFHIQIRQTWFQIEMNKKGQIFLINESQQNLQPVLLASGEKQLALGVIPPCPTGKTQIVVGEGTLVYLKPIWHLTATALASREIRILRQIKRDLLRGFSRTAIPGVVENLLTREITEDVVIAAGERQFARQSKRHLLVSTLTLAELILFGQQAHTLTPINETQAIHFEEQNLSLTELFERLVKARKNSFADWLKRVVRRREDIHFEALPKIQSYRHFSNHLTNSSEAAFTQTIQFSSRLRAFFELQSETGRRAFLSEAIKKRLEELKRRGSGLLVNFHVEELKDHLGREPVQVRLEGSGGPQSKTLTLNEVVMYESGQPLSAWFEKIAKNQNPYLAIPEPADLVGHFFEELFAGQLDMLRRGIVDVFPDFMRRYGMGIFGELEKPQSFSFESLWIVDPKNNSRDQLIELIRLQNEIELNLPYDIPELKELSGFQRVYVRALFNGQCFDLLSSIPESLRRPFVQAILKYMPATYEEILKFGLSKDWAKVKDDELARLPYEVPDVLSYDMNEAQYVSVLEYLLQNLYLPKLQEVFSHASISMISSSAGMLQRTWTLLFLRALPMPKQSGLSKLLAVLYEMLLRDPGYLNTYKWLSISDATVALKSEVVKKYIEKRHSTQDPSLVPEDWELRIFNLFAEYLFQLPPDYNEGAPLSKIIRTLKQAG